MGTPYHEQLVDRLAERLEEKGTYDHVLRNVGYWDDPNKQLGEMDVLAIRRKDGNVIFHYYEVKLNPSGKKQKANGQAKRFYSVFGNHNYKCILLSKGHVERLRPQSIYSNGSRLEQILERGAKPPSEWLDDIHFTMQDEEIPEEVMETIRG